MTRGVISDFVIDRAGNSIFGASVTVKIAGTETLATLYDASEGGSTVGNPLSTGQDGYFEAFADVGEYDITVTTSEGSSTRRNANVFDADVLANAGASISDTDDVDEGTTNLYYTEDRVTNNVTVQQNVTDIASLQSGKADKTVALNNGEGVRVTGGDLSDDSSFDLDFANITGTTEELVGTEYLAVDDGGTIKKILASDLPSGGGPADTDELPEGAANLYYTEARVNANATVTDHESRIGDNETDISTLQSTVSGHTTSIGTNTTDIATNASDISGLQSGKADKTTTLNSGEGVAVTGGDLSGNSTFDLDFANITGTAGALAGTEYLAVDDGGTIKKILASDLPSGGGGSFVPVDASTLNAKGTPVDADQVLVADSADSDEVKRVPYSNIKQDIGQDAFGYIDQLTQKVSPAGADELAIIDSEDSGNPKRATVASISGSFDSSSIGSEVDVDTGDSIVIHDTSAGGPKTVSASTLLLKENNGANLSSHPAEVLEGTDEILIRDDSNAESGKLSRLTMQNLTRSLIATATTTSGALPDTSKFLVDRFADGTAEAYTFEDFRDDTLDPLYPRKNMTSLTALAAAGTASGDLFYVWDADAGALKSITRDELATAVGTGATEGDGIDITAGVVSLDIASVSATLSGDLYGDVLITDRLAIVDSDDGHATKQVVVGYMGAISHVFNSPSEGIVDALAEQPASGDFLIVYDVSDTTDLASGTPKRVTYSDFTSGLGGSVTEGEGIDVTTGTVSLDLSTLTTELATTPADTDTFAINDGGVQKYIEWGTIAAALGGASYSGGRGIDVTGTTISFDNSSMVDTAVVGADTVPFFDGDATAQKRSFSDIISDLNIAVTGDLPASTTDLPEGTNLYYTEGRVSANTTVADHESRITTNEGDITALESGKADTTTTMTAGLGISGGGDLSANRTFNLDIGGLSTELDATPDGTDTLAISDGGTTKYITVTNLLSGAGGGSYTAGDGINITGGDAIELDIASLTADTVSSAEEFVFDDAGTPKKITFANLSASVQNDWGYQTGAANAANTATDNLRNGNNVVTIPHGAGATPDRVEVKFVAAGTISNLIQVSANSVYDIGAFSTGSNKPLAVWWDGTNVHIRSNGNIAYTGENGTSYTVDSQAKSDEWTIHIRWFIYS